jgi:hypothetical protein
MLIALTGHGALGVVTHQLVEMREMGEMVEMREKILPNLPHLLNLHQRKKDQPLMTAPWGVGTLGC